MRAVVVIGFILAGCAGGSDRITQESTPFVSPLGPPMTGEVTPNFYFLDRKFPVFTVDFQGAEYSLEGYHEPPGHDRLKYFFAYQNARDFLLDETLTCHETTPWHLVCFNDRGENMSAYLAPKSASSADQEPQVTTSDRDDFDTLFFLELPKM